MTATIKAPEQVITRHPVAAPAVPGRWHALAVAAICVVAAVLYAWRIGGEGWGNP